MKVISRQNVTKVPVEMEGAHNVCKQLPIGTSDGSSTFSFRVFTLGPGGYTPFHTHEWEHINYVISGTGSLVDKDKNETALIEGSFAYVEPGEQHQYKNTSDTEDFIMICAVPSAYE